MDSTPPTDLWEPCDVWDKISKPAHFKPFIARLIVWLISTLCCAYCVYFLARLISWRTSNL